jgi:hypothetical protein
MPERDTPLDLLWKEYEEVFHDFDDLTLARWMCQTLGQLQGRAWRLSHPLLGAYRLAAQVAHDRQIWLKRLATAPHAYADAPCCRAPLLVLLTRDAAETGLMCQHCGETAVPFDELPPELTAPLKTWAEQYCAAHAVAHWDERQRAKAGDYDNAFETAARQAEQFLGRCGSELAPLLLNHYPAVVWEDQDECLEVHPEDVHS